MKNSNLQTLTCSTRGVCALFGAILTIVPLNQSAAHPDVVVDPVVRVQVPAPHEMLPPPVRWAVRRVATAPQRVLNHLDHRVAQARQLFGQGGGGNTPALVDELREIVHPKRSGTTKALVIRSSEPEANEQIGVEEDMAVMSRILDKALEENLGRQDFPRKAMGIDVFFAPMSSPVRSMVLEGYGALFLLHANFPLLPPSVKTPAAKDEQPVDSAWEEAKRELYGPRTEGKFVRGPVEEYDEEKVQKLQEVLLQALKNATNIRNLKPDDFVTLCVFGGATGPVKVKSTRTTVKRGQQPGEEGEQKVVRIEDQASGGARGTIMTIRVKKADVDAFAKAKMNLEDFRKNARITAYAGDVDGDPSPFPFGFSAGGFESR
jgi:hypothetical protein